jgi:formiminotetrahydrofolate cyclodeaminase
MTYFVLLVAEKGNRNAITDAGVSALLIEAAARGAAMNARINLASIDDDTFIEENLALIDADLDSIQKSVEKALSVVRSKIGT